MPAALVSLETTNAPLPAREGGTYGRLGQSQKIIKKQDRSLVEDDGGKDLVNERIGYVQDQVVFITSTFPALVPSNDVLLLACLLA